MKRPIGLILAVIVLGLTATLALLTAAGMAFSAATLASHGLAMPASPAGPPPPSAHLTAIVFGVTAIVFLLFAAFAIATVVGLLGLRNWARYAVLSIGGLLAFVGFSSLAALAMLPSILAASQPPAAALTPTMMHGVLAIGGLIYGSIAALGTWWLVYFNLRSVKAYFLPGYRQQPVYPAAPPPRQRQSAASLATPGGLAEDSYPYPNPPYAMPAYIPPPAGRLAHIPTSIIVIAILFFLATLSCAIIALLPLPAFLLGFLLTGPIAPRLLYLLYAAGSLAIGIGLLRLRNAARLGCYLFSALGFVNILVSQLPWGKARYAAYTALVQTQLHTGGAQPTLPPSFQQSILLFSLFFAAILYGVQIWLIERHRTLFK